MTNPYSKIFDHTDKEGMQWYQLSHGLDDLVDATKQTRHLIMDKKKFKIEHIKGQYYVFIPLKDHQKNYNEISQPTTYKGVYDESES